VIFVKNLIVKFFSMVFCCFKKAETPPVQLAEAPQQEPEPEPAPPEAEVVEPAALRLIPRLQNEVDLLNEFEQLPQNEQDRIFIRIGQDRHMYWLRRGSDLEAGKAKVYANPQILLQYIVRLPR
jgi:acyl-CoA thioesterase